ncbi:hypothetical protein XNC1_3485 [Xenorhabdus nematophila ATCC 19061]|uniref:Uncharacterized protein n=1 Tax=Xenorhabdus nematophila (strain ATCC 19061 / DSM 3370 / CCUG 14189 / LMG 1036 / NCIMB 9965 / AN6) TaxID=406817 RepID=D3V9H5_XENNA|nr:hypothetical protein [Xenorhabdus bovienii]MDE1474756.1 hypothetical protein [Xenorhabdus bovienii]CBJ91525.1 hypothetical protein XNC1_3485 [Xenorhabdus nematophila ATCC 19061]
MQHQHGGQPAGMIFVACSVGSFLHQAPFSTGHWCYDRHGSVRLVICFFLVIDQIAKTGLSSPRVIYYLEHLFSITLLFNVKVVDEF